MKIEDNNILDIKKSTRNLISFNDGHIETDQEAEITSENFIRRNNEDWEPKI